MCGVNGLLVLEGRNLVELQPMIESMNSSIVHRGGDHSAFFISDSIALGHCRLSIQDITSAADQPFTKHGLTLVYNGEIYNFRQLRAELSDVEWQSNSDTEVLIELWHRYGADCLTRLRGMFAFAIYAHDTKELYLCRDHFGIKPLYYVIQNGIFAFSSELKALTAAGFQFTVDYGVLAESALLCWVRDSQCIFSEAKKLQPGHLIKVIAGAVEVRPYSSTADLIIKPVQQGKSREFYVNELNEVLLDSVEKHLVSDVPVSAFLSGGLDSSLLVAMASKYNSDLSCYTIRFSETDKKFEKMADDHFYASRVADNFGLKLHTIDVKPDLAGLLKTVVHHLDEPIGDSAAINTYLICQAARASGVKVILSGMGADEIFGGYRKHLANIYAGQYKKLPSPCRKSVESLVNLFPSSSASKGFKAIRWAKKFLSFANLPADEAFLRSYSYYDLAELADGCLFDAAGHLAQLASDHKDLFSKAYATKGLIDAMCYTDVTNFMVGLNLHYTDRASMACSMEVRVPFVDEKVISYGFSIPPEMKIQGGQQKFILKKVAEKWLPSEIIYRPKSPFTLPLRSWIKNDLNDFVSDYVLSVDGLAGRKIFKQSFLQQIVNDERSGTQDNAQKIWHLLTLEQWLRNNQT